MPSIQSWLGKVFYTVSRRHKGFGHQSGSPSALEPALDCITAVSLLQLAMLECPGAALQATLKSGVLARDLPELARCAGLHARNRRKTLLEHSARVCEVIRAVPHLKLAGLLHDIGKPPTERVEAGHVSYSEHAEIGSEMARQVLERLGYEPAEVGRVCHLIFHHMFQLHAFHSDKAIRRWIRTVGAENAMDLLELRRADIVGSTESYWAGWADLSLLARRVRDELDGLADAEAGGGRRTRRLPVSGRDVMEILEISPGPEVGRVLKRLEEIAESRPDMRSREALLELMRRKE